MLSRFGLLAASVCLASAVPSHSFSGRGFVGEWDLLWSISESEGRQNSFREIVGERPEFPLTWRQITSLEGSHLAFFDLDGNVEETIPLAPGEQAVASRDGSSYLLWTDDLLNQEFSNFRFFRRDQTIPDWEATARGMPALFAPDGSLFVIAALKDRPDLLHPGKSETDGTLQVVGASGDVRGELPIFPHFAELTGDGRRIAFLHNRELVVLGRDGRIDWTRPVELDQLSARDGVAQLSTAGGVIVVGGSGQVAFNRGTYVGLQPKRVGAIHAFDDRGNELWKHVQSEGDDLWFQVTTALSKNGNDLVTSHATAGSIVIRKFDARTGELLWERDTRRRLGYRVLSIASDGSLVVLANGDAQTGVVAWNRAGTVVWDGEIPLRGRVARIAPGNLLVSDRWIVRLLPAAES